MEENMIREKILTHSQFLQELPIRIAKRIINLQKLPYELNKFVGMQEIHDNYVKSFEKLSKSRYPQDINDCNNYVDLLNDLKISHSDVEFKMQGV